MAEKVGYLFGYPIAHSMSPLVHDTSFRALDLKWSYSLLESKDIDDFIKRVREASCYGSAVTMPHKVAIIPYLDDLTAEGRDVGAVNTIFKRQSDDGRTLLVGTNTDVIGIREAFFQNIPSSTQLFPNRPGMVIGGGGAARSAVFALQRYLHCKPIYIVNRVAEEVEAVIAECTAKGFGHDLIHVQTVKQAEDLDAPGAIVACVPDVPPRTENEWQARNVLEMFFKKMKKGVMLEMCYHPSPDTTLGRLAKEAGWRVILGTEAMIYQGLEQDKLWTGSNLEALPVEGIKAAVAAKLVSHRSKR